MQLVIGLGNPGKRYARTRHNVGFLVVERLAERWGIDAGSRNQYGALLGDGMIRYQRAMLARPQKFMNLSGQPAASLKGYYKLDNDAITVVHDDMELPFGEVACRQGGGHKGHNGLRDLNRHLGSDYRRVRVGIGRPPEGWDPADYVLGKWSEEERSELPALVDRAADAVESILADGLEAAAERFQSSPHASRARSHQAASTTSAPTRRGAPSSRRPAKETP